MSRRETQRVLIALARLEQKVEGIERAIGQTGTPTSLTNAIPVGGGVTGILAGIYVIWAQATGRQ